MSEYPDFTGHIKNPYLTDSIVRKIIILPNLDIEKQLLKRALEAPHICDDESCPGNINRQKLELLEKMLEKLKSLDDRANLNSFYQPCQLIAKVQALLEGKP